MKVACERNQNIERSRVYQACLPFTKSFPKIQLGSKWNSTFYVVPTENLSGSDGTSEKIVTNSHSHNSHPMLLDG